MSAHFADTAALGGAVGLRRSTVLADPAAPGLAVVSFPDPQPARDVLLLRRATTPAGGWFDDLGDLLRAAGQSVMKA